MTATHNPQPTPHNPSSVPRLDLAPKRKKPLSLWNPLDYLTLLYWAFFFPQAIRWYVETFGLPWYQKKTGREVWQVVLHDPVQRRLITQALFVVVVVELSMFYGLAWILHVFGVPVGWNKVLLGAVVGVAFGILVGLAFSVAGGVAFGIASGIAGGVALGGLVGIAIGMAGGMTNSILLGLATGVVLNAAFAPKAGVSVRVMGVVVVIILLGIVTGALSGITSGVAFCVIAGLVTVQPIEWLLLCLLWRLQNTSSWRMRLVWLPLLEG